MTIQREEPGLLAATCDGCGERRVLDLLQDAQADEIAEALGLLGWVRREPERVKFNEVGSRRHGALFEQDFCADCQSDEPRPHPRFGSGRVARSRHDAFANDPCDEWPRSLVFAAAGLRPDCGHPRAQGVGECAMCRAGYPIGENRIGWRRA